MKRQSSKGISSTPRQRPPYVKWLETVALCLLLTNAVYAAVSPMPATAGDPSQCAVLPDRCYEWISLEGTSSRLFVYRTHDLRKRNEQLTRALIFVHGIKRDADNHFRTALAGAFLDGVSDSTLIVAPRFASKSRPDGNGPGHCEDTLGPNEANWFCEDGRTDTWRSGGAEVGQPEISSFDFVDQTVRLLADKRVFPNLHTVVVAGHSAGGQFVTRYQMTNRVHDLPGIEVSYVVANPSSYAYLDDMRPTASALPDNISAEAPGFRPPRANPLPPFVSYPDARNCTAFNDWPYGLGKRTGYAAKASVEQLKVQAASRPVTYLLGDSDVLPMGVFDTSCPATAQGPTRLARGLAFARYMNELHGARHNVIVVPFCGHSARCVFTADVAFRALFSK